MLDLTVGTEKGGECEVVNKVIHPVALSEAGLAREVLYCFQRVKCKSFCIRTAVSP